MQNIMDTLSIFISAIQNNKKKLLTEDVILLIWSLAFDNYMPDLSQPLSRPCYNVLSWMFRLCTKNILNSDSQR